MKLVFQHLDTQSPNKFITLFGRTLDDKSVAVHVKDFSPKLYIVIDRDVRRLQALIRASLIRYKESKHILKFDPDSVKNIDSCIDKHEKKLLWFKIVKGQDITEYNEEGAHDFLEITTIDKYVFNDLKAILSRKCEFIYRQMMLDTETRMVKKWCQKYEVDCQTNLKYMLDKPYTIYNDQVDYGLQYLISKDIYSCNWMEVDGQEVSKKQTTCDIGSHTFRADRTK